MTFWQTLCLGLVELGKCEEYAPLIFAGSLLSRIPTAQKRDFPVYNVRPRLNEMLFEEIAHMFGITLYIFGCDSRGYKRSLISIHGKDRVSLSLLYVSDLCDFADSLLALVPSTRHVLSRESREIIDEAIARLAAKQAETHGIALRLPLKPERTDPLRPPLQSYPMPDECNRWLYVTKPDLFLSVFACRQHCGSVFDVRKDRQRHERFHCGFDPGLPLTMQTFTKIHFTNKTFKVQERLDEILEGIGYHYSAKELTPAGMLVFDIETQQEGVNATLSGGRSETRSVHKIFCLGYAWNLTWDAGQIQSQVLYRAVMDDDYELVKKWVSHLVELAKTQAETESLRTAEIWNRLKADEVILEKEHPNGYHLSRLRYCMRKLRQRQGTLVIGGWNSSRLDFSSLLLLKLKK